MLSLGALANERGEITEKWGAARKLYDAGSYADALQSLGTEAGGAGYFYNVGTVQLRLGKLGLAVAYLEKANKLQPHDSDIQHNLMLARAALGQAIGADQLDSASNWLESIADAFSLDECRLFIGLISLFSTVIWIRSYLKNRNLRKTATQPAGILALLGFLMAIGLFAAERSAAAHPLAVAFEADSTRSGPGELFYELGRIEAGRKIRLLSERPGWYQIRYNTDQIGWIRSSSLLLL